MKKIITSFTILLSSFFFLGNGCGKRIYYQMITYDNPTPMILEVKMDSTKGNSFAGLDYMQLNGKYPDEEINIIRLNYQTSITKKFSVTNFGVQVFAGNYLVKGIDGKFTSDSVYDGNKFGYGGRASVMGGLNFNIKGFRLGLGFEPSISFDFGDYSTFRINASKKGIIDSDAGFIKFNLNIFPYISIPVTKSSLINLQMNIGFPGFISPIITFQHENYVVWISHTGERINIGLMVNYDVIKSNF